MVKQLWRGFKVALSFGSMTNAVKVADLELKLKDKCLAIVRLDDQNSYLRKQLNGANVKIQMDANARFDLEEDCRLLKIDLEASQVSDMVRHVEIQRQAKEIGILKTLLQNTRKLYPGQKYYNPKNHSDVTIWVCAAFNDWYMIRQQNEARPNVLSKAEFDATYPGYIQMPAMSANRKNIV